MGLRRKWKRLNSAMILHLVVGLQLRLWIYKRNPCHLKKMRSSWARSFGISKLSSIRIRLLKAKRSKIFSGTKRAWQEFSLKLPKLPKPAKKAPSRVRVTVSTLTTDWNQEARLNHWEPRMPLRIVLPASFHLWSGKRKTSTSSMKNLAQLLKSSLKSKPKSQKQYSILTLRRIASKIMDFSRTIFAIITPFWPDSVSKLPSNT